MKIFKESAKIWIFDASRTVTSLHVSLSESFLTPILVVHLSLLQNRHKTELPFGVMCRRKFYDPLSSSRITFLQDVYYFGKVKNKSQK